MATKKYPIGTKIRYIGYCTQCRNKTGKIIRVTESCCYLDLPQSSCNHIYSFGISSSWNDIELLVVKGEQLLFLFMEKQDA